MKIKYFPDSDTLYVQLTNNEVVETRDLDNNTIIDLDSRGNLVGMTIEHASLSANISEFSFQKIEEQLGNASS